METSAKTGLNAQEMFVRCAEVLYKDYLQYNRNKPQLVPPLSAALEIAR